MVIPKDFSTVKKVGHYRRLLALGITQRIYRRLLAVELVPIFHSRPRFPLYRALIFTSLLRSPSETIIAIDSEAVELLFLYDGGLAASGGVVAVWAELVVAKGG
ncbi:hypothetical protein LR48_Vigan09g003200 [Vigna angularis]|uniref:Uncharacterized protein n=1 Tax=Phaseolus angularis TaxID=3914 RepID=A0A0L9T6S5_PHAAN|nr:hypothetical protein LR48_Vigan252s001700 [Vigna angularis]KOM51373.1 hypothetical protein LR48_Vigan09g003200 [Vigna angularis]